MPETRWWLCPNDPPCPHAGVVHDIYDYTDLTPRCCVEGCDCGQLISVTSPKVVPKGAREVSTEEEQVMPCGQLQPDVVAPLAPYRCSEPAGHSGMHTAVLHDGTVLAVWGEGVSG